MVVAVWSSNIHAPSLDFEAVIWVQYSKVILVNQDVGEMTLNFTLKSPLIKDWPHAGIPHILVSCQTWKCLWEWLHLHVTEDTILAPNQTNLDLCHYLSTSWIQILSTSCISNYSIYWHWTLAATCKKKVFWFSGAGLFIFPLETQLMNHSEP